jgi:aminopeptidase N
MIAVYDGTGWNVEIPPPAGDVTYADTSLFTVQVSAPVEVTVVGAGQEVHRSVDDGRQRLTYETGPARDFYLAASSSYAEFMQNRDGVALRFYAPGERTAGAEAALEYAAAALSFFESRLGPYPYGELDLVATPTLALGVEYPGVIAIAARILEPDDPRLEATVVHEVAHQWFYNLVGNDQLDEPWLDESFAQFVTMEYFEHVYGVAGREGFEAYLQARWASSSEPEMSISLPVAAYTGNEYGAIV